jgi:hypothetical protein
MRDARPYPNTLYVDSTAGVLRSTDYDDGVDNVAVTYDGTHYVFVGSMWQKGLWRYVEP